MAATELTQLKEWLKCNTGGLDPRRPTTSGGGTLHTTGAAPAYRPVFAAPAHLAYAHNAAARPATAAAHYSPATLTHLALATVGGGGTHHRNALLAAMGGAGGPSLPRMSQTVITRETAQVAVKRAPKSSDVEIAIDNSGSMSGTPIAQAKAALQAFVAALRPNDAVRVQSFGRTVEELLPMTKIKRLDTTTLHTSLQGLRGDGGTTAMRDALANQLVAAKDRLAQYKASPSKAGRHSGRRQKFLLLTDGQDNASHITEAALQALVRKPGMELPQIFIVALGEATTSSELEALGKLNGVKLVKETDASNLPAAFNRIRCEMMEVVKETRTERRMQLVQQTSENSTFTFNGKPVHAVGAGKGYSQSLLKERRF